MTAGDERVVGNHMRAGKWEQAEEELRKALAIDPGFSQSLQMLAVSLDAERKYEDAVQVWGRLAEGQPEHALYAASLAYALERAGREREAVEAYRRLVSVDPDPSRAQAQYLLALARMAMWETFGEERDRLLQMRSLTAERMLRLAENLLQTGPREEAIAVLEGAIGRFPEDPDLLNLLAWELIESGEDLSRGVALADRAVKLRPDEPGFLDTLGWGYLRQGRAGEAVSILERASQGPFVAEIAHHLALAYLEAGEDAEARLLIRKILERAPQYEGRSRLEALLHE